MMALNPRPLIFFNDTKLVSIHADLKVIPRGVLPKPNITCDPVQAAFYANILDSVASLRRTAISVLRQTADAMSVNQQLTRVVNGKVTYLVKTTDTLNTKVKQCAVLQFFFSRYVLSY